MADEVSAPAADAAATPSVVAVATPPATKTDTLTSDILTKADVLAKTGTIPKSDTLTKLGTITKSDTTAPSPAERKTAAAESAMSVEASSSVVAEKKAPLAEAEVDLGAGAPEQVLAAGGVSRRRRGTAAGGKRRSPSGGARRRAPTPEPPRHPPPDEEEEDELYASISPSSSAAPVTEAVPPPPIPSEEPKAKPRRRLKDKDKEREKVKRSLSSPGDDRVALSDNVPPVVLKTFTSDNGGTRTETIVMQSKREFKVERIELPSELKYKATLSPAKEAPAKLMSTTTPSKPETEVVPSKKETTPEEDSVKVKTKLSEAEPVDEKPTEPKKDEDKEEPKKSFLPEIPWREMMKIARSEWKVFKEENPEQYDILVVQRNRCASALLLIIIYCGMGGFIFRFTEGAFEAFYKCGVKRVKRNFVDDLWLSSHHLREEDWKSQARRKLMEFEDQLHTAHEAGVTSYSGQKSWSFLNAVVYSLTVVTTIGYGHLSPATTTGRAITIVYAIFGIPLFLILLADFGKLFTRGIKFLWAFVRRLYFTGSCRKVRRTVPVQEVMKGVQLVYDFAKFRRPSQVPPGEAPGEECDVQTPLNQQQPPQVQIHEPSQPPEDLQQNIPLDGREPSTPVPSVFEVDDEFNLPISIAITILLTYIFVGAAVYYIWEDWGFFESFYFVFISMSTIGFGDFVPQHPMYMMASIVYLVFGLALTSMCINVVQEKLSDSFRQASAKIGATIGLRVTDEDGNITPITPQNTQPEETEIAPTMTKSAST